MNKKESLLSELAILTAQKQQSREKLMTMTSGVLPMMLVKDLLENITFQE